MYDRDWAMVVCDACNDGYHYDCMGLDTPPAEDIWRCETCIKNNIQVRPPAEDFADTLPHQRDSIFLSSNQRKAFAEAAQLDGTQIYRKHGSIRGHRETGVAHLRPVEEHSKKTPIFDIYYDDGVIEENLSRTKIKNRQVKAILVNSILTDKRWEWDLKNRASLTSALHFLMPGNWTNRHITNLHNQLVQFLSSPATKLPTVPTLEEEITPLLTHVDFSNIWRILDPFSGTGAIAHTFSSWGLKVHTNDLNPNLPSHTHEDALRLNFYTTWNGDMPPDAIVTSPWFGLLDIAIPLLIHAAKILVCVHVPGHYLSDAHPARASYLKRLAASHRLHVLWNLPRGPTGRRCAWLLIFKHKGHREKMLKYPISQALPCAFP